MMDNSRSAVKVKCKFKIQDDFCSVLWLVNWINGADKLNVDIYCPTNKWLYEFSVFIWENKLPGSLRFPT